jgi:hypothetical protein
MKKLTRLQLRALPLPASDHSANQGTSSAGGHQRAGHLTTLAIGTMFGGVLAPADVGQQLQVIADV